MNNDNIKLIATSGQNVTGDSVYIYSKLNGKIIQSLSPINKETLHNNAFSKAMIFYEKYNLLFIGLNNGFIEAYHVAKTNDSYSIVFQYSLDCGIRDWVFRFQLIESTETLIFCIGNCLYFAMISYDES